MNHELGRFIVPDTEDWDYRIHYEPEPLPIAVRGAFNPWEAERKRQLRLAEDAAWKEIQRLQALYRQKDAELSNAIRYYNFKVSQLEERVGKVSGVEKITGLGVKALQVVFPLNFGLDKIVGSVLRVFGIGDKKPNMQQVNDILGELQRMAVEIPRLQAELQAIVDQLRAAVQAGTQIQSAQEAMRQQDIMHSEAAYQAQRQAAEALAARQQAVAYAAAMRRKKVSDDDI